MVALHFDNSTLKFTYVVKVIQYPYFFPDYCISNLANKHGITHIPAYKYTHLNVKATDYVSWERLVLEWHLLAYIAQSVFQLLVQGEMDVLVSLHTSQSQHDDTL